MIYNGHRWGYPRISSWGYRGYWGGGKWQLGHGNCHHHRRRWNGAAIGDVHLSCNKIGYIWGKNDQKWTKNGDLEIWVHLSTKNAGQYPEQASVSANNAEQAVGVAINIYKHSILLSFWERCYCLTSHGVFVENPQGLPPIEDHGILGDRCLMPPIWQPTASQ